MLCRHGAEQSVTALADGMRDEYARHPRGAAGWYMDHGATYRNPHEDAVAAMVTLAVREQPDWFARGRILDLACGSGEVTLALRDAGVDASRIDAADPFTSTAYLDRTGVVAEPWSFADIAQGVSDDRQWRTVVCSYGLHLCEPSWLATVCMQLAIAAENLVVITPHKRPAIEPGWGWTAAGEHRDPVWRVRLRCYSSSSSPSSS